MDFNIILLSFIQGISEILPISSSVNLHFFSHIFNINTFSFSLKIALHTGSLIALMIFFRREIFDIFSGIFGSKSIKNAALGNRMDVIVTRNTTDFKAANILVMTSKELVEYYEK